MPKFKVGDYVSVKKQFMHHGFEIGLRRIINIKDNIYTYSLSSRATDGSCTAEQEFHILEMLMELDISHMASLEVNEWLK
jgi:hypothetical protein